MSKDQIRNWLNISEGDLEDFTDALEDVLKKLS